MGEVDPEAFADRLPADGSERRGATESGGNARPWTRSVRLGLSASGRVQKQELVVETLVNSS